MQVLSGERQRSGLFSSVSYTRKLQTHYPSSFSGHFMANTGAKGLRQLISLHFLNLLKLIYFIQMKHYP